MALLSHKGSGGGKPSLETYLEFGQGGEADSLAFFDDGSAATVEINVDIFTFVHTELAGFEDQDAVFDARDMSWARDRAAN